MVAGAPPGARRVPRGARDPHSPHHITHAAPKLYILHPRYNPPPPTPPLESTHKGLGLLNAAPRLSTGTRGASFTLVGGEMEEWQLMRRDCVLLIEHFEARRLYLWCGEGTAPMLKGLGLEAASYLTMVRSWGHIPLWG